MTWYYKRSEPGLWTVGFHEPGGTWHPESDHPDADQAADRTRWLNGGNPPPRQLKDPAPWSYDVCEIGTEHGNSVLLTFDTDDQAVSLDLKDDTRAVRLNVDDLELLISTLAELRNRMDWEDGAKLKLGFVQEVDQ